MIIDGIYVISVDLDQDFIQSVKDRLSKLRAPISKIQKKSIRIGSNKGDKILEVLTDLRKYPNWNLKNSETKFWNREITPGEVGCITSHMNMWSEFHQSETNVGLFLEQDFFPEFESTNWSVFDEIEGYDWDIILLGRHQLGEDIETNFNYFIQPGYSYQAHAYLLSKKGADKLIKYYFKTLSKNLIPTDEFLPATFTKHPRADIERMYSIKHMNALALRVDMISQSDWEGTGRSRTAPNDIQNFKVIENVITDDQIQFLLNYWNTIKCDTFTDINVWNSNLKTKTKIVAPNRIVEIVGIPKNSIPFLTQILHNCFKQVTNNFELECPHYFTYYPTNGKHTLHKDTIEGFNREWVITLYLNDDFKGGELVINNQIAPIKKGSAILYKGNIMHEVRPVISGERYVITECAGSK